MDINLFTGRLRQEFLLNSQVVATPAPIDIAVTQVPSTSRVERYPWMFPPPRMSRYLGRRRYAELQQTLYQIPNHQYDASMVIEERDIEDDLVGGYAKQIGKLTIEAGKPFEAREVLVNLNNGSSQVCFDGSNFFSTTHNIGGFGTTPTGFGGAGNALTFTATGTVDAQTYKFVLLIHGDAGNPVKPLLWQNRKPLDFITDAGTPQSRISMKNHYVIQREGAPGFGYWWDGIQMICTNLPSLLEIFKMIDGCVNASRNFTLPRNLPTDAPQRVHEQQVFTNLSATIVCDTYLERLFRHALGEQIFGVTAISSTSTSGIQQDNIYYKMFGVIPSGYLNTH